MKVLEAWVLAHKDGCLAEDVIGLSLNGDSQGFDLSRAAVNVVSSKAACAPSRKEIQDNQDGHDIGD